MREAIRKIALRVAKDPTTATVEDARKLARAWLLQTDGKLPRRA